MANAAFPCPVSDLGANSWMAPLRFAAVAVIGRGSGRPGLPSRHAGRSRRLEKTSPAGKILVTTLEQRGVRLAQNFALPRSEAGDVAKRPALITELKSRGLVAIVIVGYLGRILARRIAEGAAIRLVAGSALHEAEGQRF